MGGGVGVSIHGSHRVAGERFQFAMPEVGIGFFPDVGATYVLPRLPWRCGYYLALTGKRLGRGSAAVLGIATHCVAAERFDAILDGVGGGRAAASRARRRSGCPHEEAPELAHAGTIAQAFGGETVEAILAALDDFGSEGSGFRRRGGGRDAHEIADEPQGHAGGAAAGARSSSSRKR